MEKCLFSKYTKPDAMDSIKADIVRYNKIKRYAFSLIVKMGGDKPLSDGTSIHGKTELDAAGFIRADENDKRAPA